MGALSRLTGIRMFGPAEIPDGLAATGFTDIRRRSYGLMRFAGATLG